MMCSKSTTTGTSKKVLFAASECVPFIKTGGLADVCGALPKWFRKDDWDVRVVIPNYTCIPDHFRNEFQYVTHFYMHMGPALPDKYVGILEYEYENIHYYFIDNMEYFDSPTPYGNIRFDVEKFCYFSKAVLSMLPLIGFQPDLIHCHDWETGLIPVYLKNEFQGDMFFWGMKTIMTIHNLRFQGVWDIETVQSISGLPEELFTPDKLEYKKDANMLKGGLVYADYITTVSETYANEIQMPYYGEGLDGLLSARRLDMQGIVNGIDYSIYDPMTDPQVHYHYDIKNFRRQKPLNKERLQKELGLTVDKKKFMIALVSRLTDQKGLDLVNHVIEGISDEFTQFVVVGTGENRYEDAFRYFAGKHPERISANICYNDELVHRLLAASDAFLVPSQFEPCGLTQMMACRYGSLPIVRETGGLRDTVHPYNEYENSGNGFSFTNYNAHEMLGIINYAKQVYFEKKRDWNRIVERAMSIDFSWKVSANRYEGLYRYLLGMTE